MTTSERVKAIRKDIGLTQEDFGERISLVASMICQIENGTAKITERTIRGICREYNINRDWLLNGKGDMYTSQGKENLVTEFANIISKYPSLYETAKMVSAHMTKDDWKRVNELLEEMGE